MGVAFAFNADPTHEILSSSNQRIDEDDWPWFFVNTSSVGAGNGIEVRNMAQHCSDSADQGRSDDVLGVAETCAFFGGQERPIDRSTLYRGIRRGIYPRPIRIGANSSRWLKSECEEARKRFIGERGPAFQ